MSMGQLLEQSVFQNIRQKGKLSFYSKNSSLEIDFIIDDQTALEVKSTASKQDIEFLRRRVAALKIPENYLISLEFSDEPAVVLATDL